MNSYRVVYSIADAGYHAWEFVSIAALIVAVGAAFLIHDVRHPQSGVLYALRRVFLLAMLLCSSVLLITVAVGTRAEYLTNRQALATGAFKLVTGAVEHFVPGPRDGHGSEEFDVAGHHYSYSDYVVVPAFHQTQSAGGPVREGLQVRIADRDGQILRLEIAAP